MLKLLEISTLERSKLYLSAYEILGANPHGTDLQRCRESFCSAISGRSDARTFLGELAVAEMLLGVIQRFDSGVYIAIESASAYLGVSESTLENACELIGLRFCDEYENYGSGYHTKKLGGAKLWAPTCSDRDSLRSVFERAFNPTDRESIEASEEPQAPPRRARRAA